jgi:ketosteroid isomerase-like protein
VSDPREELILRGFAASNRGDYQAVLDILDPDVEVRTDTELGNPGVYRGHDGWRAWTRAWLDVWEEFRLDPGEIEQHGDDFLVPVVASGRGMGSGVEVSQELLWVFTIPGRRATRIHLYRDREMALESVAEVGESAGTQDAPRVPRAGSARVCGHRGSAGG